MNLLYPCKICKRQIAQRARFCPTCGIKEPGPEAGYVIQTISVFYIVGIFIVIFSTREWFMGDTPPHLWVWLFHICLNMCAVGILFNAIKKYL
jgi:hypothetical protein